MTRAIAFEEGAMNLTVYFDGQFWVGVAEESTPTGLRACRHVFGAEPSDAEVLEFVNGRLLPLLERARAGIALDAAPSDRTANLKRAAREAARAVRERGVSTFAQAALQAEYESRKVESRIATRDERDAERARRYLIARRKAKE
jgi:hypothetical protein